MTPLLEVEQKGKTYAMTPTLLLDELTYSCYKFQRQRTPEIKPEEWLRLFPTALQMEQRFQEEQVP